MASRHEPTEGTMEFLASSFRLPNWWDRHPSEDPRFKGMMRVAWAMGDALEFAAGTYEYDRELTANDEDFIPQPLDLVAMLRELATRIESLTERS